MHCKSSTVSHRLSLITPRHQLLYVIWARHHQHWTVEDWRHIKWSHSHVSSSFGQTFEFVCKGSRAGLWIQSLNKVFCKLLFALYCSGWGSLLKFWRVSPYCRPFALPVYARRWWEFVPTTDETSSRNTWLASSYSCGPFALQILTPLNMWPFSFLFMQPHPKISSSLHEILERIFFLSICCGHIDFLLLPFVFLYQSFNIYQSLYINIF